MPRSQLRELALRLIVSDPAAVSTHEIAALLDVRLPSDHRGLPILNSRKVDGQLPCKKTILAAIELGRRFAEEQAQLGPTPERLCSTSESIEYCKKAFHRLAMFAKREEMHLLTLDTKNRVIDTHLISIGTLDASLVHPREVFRPAIVDSAASIILVHNHPSGDPTPSREDHQVTGRLDQAAKLLGIDLLDHIIVAKHGVVSVREK